MTVRLTHAMALALAHRLEVPEAIAEAIGRDASDGEVADVADDLRLQAAAGYVTATTDLERAVLADAVNGSVWWAVNEEDASFRRNGALTMQRVERTLEALAKRISEEIGEEVVAPFH